MKEIAVKAENLLNQMTLREKIAQMYQTDPGSYSKSLAHEAMFDGPVTGPEQDRIVSKEIMYSLGSILNASDADTCCKIQKEHLENNRLKIPLMFMYDIIHGFKTIYPIPLGLACSWDTSLVEETCRMAAREGTAAGINVTFAPMADLVRDARWGRVMESTGEDPYLNQAMTAAYVRGFQGDDPGSADTLAACVKHYAAYGAPEAGRDYNTVELSERTLRNFYLPGYKAGVDAGAEMVMSSFNVYDGVPATGSKFLLRKILRDEWGFNGVVISDWASVNEMISHMVAQDGAEAARMAVEAGVDIEMITTEYVCHLEKLVSDRTVDVHLIDEAVRRILTLKFKLGLFEDPFRYIKPGAEKKYFLCPEHREIARKSAAKSMVLLKNDGILPFSKEIKSIAVVGPLADSGQILGWWRACGNEEDSVTLKQGIVNKLGARAGVRAVKGCDYLGEDTAGFPAAIEAAKNADAVVLALGEHQDMSGEGASRAYINLPGQQQRLAEEILKLGKPTVLVLFSGRPLELKWFHDHVPAILEAWFPGTEGGNAVADVLFGDVNPSGRLTMSFPHTVGQLPLYYNSFNTGRPKGSEQNENRFCSCYIDAPNAPLYPFGYGLSYTCFEYSGIRISSSRLSGAENLKVSVEVANTGKYQGEETVQMYIRDLAGSVTRPVLELKGYRKIALAPGQKETVEFEIDPRMLRFYGITGEHKAEPGRFKVFIGQNAASLTQECEFELV